MYKTALLFAGQGAQAVGMGQSFAERFPIARALFDEANAALGYDLASICFEGPDSTLTKTEHAQPGIYLVSWVAFRLLSEQVPGLKWDATAGLSLGEFTALAAAGGFKFLDGLRIVRQRGLYMQEACEATQGSMAAVIGLGETETRSVCEESGVALANLNCPGQIVISGEAQLIQKACDLAKQKGAKKAMPLNVAGAYHSPLMATASGKLKAELANVQINQPANQVISNVSAEPHGDSSRIRTLLVEQVTAPVRWEASMRFLISQGFNRFIELGPGSALSGFMKRTSKEVEMLSISDVASLEATVAKLGQS